MGDSELALSGLNAQLVALPRRAEAERIGDDHPVTSPGNLSQELATSAHQILFGRAGTGKTHALLQLLEARRRDGDGAVYVDCRRTGAATGDLATPARDIRRHTAALLLKDIFALLLVELDQIATPRRKARGKGRSLDALERAISRIDVLGVSMGETTVMLTEDLARAAKAAAELSTKPKGSLSGGWDRKQQQSESRTVKTTGPTVPAMSFPEVTTALANVVSHVPNQRLWVLLDEWHSIPRDVQPSLVELLDRAVLPVKGVTLKIASVEAMSQLSAIGGAVTPKGFRTASIDRNLADVVGSDRRGAFIDAVVRSHLRDHAAAALFCTGDAQDLLAQAAAGIPRDAFEIAGLAAELARDAVISAQHVAEAARIHFHRDKEPMLRSLGAWRLFAWLSERTIRRSGHPLVLLPSESRSNALLQTIYETRAIHLWSTDALVDDFQQSWDLWEIDRAYFWELHWDDPGVRRQSRPALDQVPKLALPHFTIAVPASEQPREPATTTLEPFAHGPAAVSTRVLLATANDRTGSISSRLKPGRYLILLTDDSATGDFVVPIADTVLHIGRSPSADLILDDATVSRGHALVSLRGSHPVIHDDRSRNGVFVNGDRVTEAFLKNGDVIALGLVTLNYVEVRERPHEL